MSEEVYDEKWLLSKGWEKIEGFKLNHEMIDDTWEHSFWSEEAFGDVAVKCVFYQNQDLNDEFASDDLDDCIEMQKEHESED